MSNLAGNAGRILADEARRVMATPPKPLDPDDDQPGAGKVFDFDAPAPLLKQVPILALFCFVFLVVAFTTNVSPILPFTSWPALIGALLVVVVITGVDFLFSLFPAFVRFQVIVPLVDLLAIGLLSYGTGVRNSVLEVFIVLPLFWIAAHEGRRFIAYAALGGSAALLVPFLLGWDLTPNFLEPLRMLFVAMLFTAIALLVNRIAALARYQLILVDQLGEAAAKELDRAAQVQRALLPKDPDPLAGYQVAGACVPSKSVGGDFFDWYSIDGGLAFSLGDVMGKGVGAGMVATTARAVIRSAAGKENPVVALERMADVLSTDLRDASTFLTLFHARLSAADGVVSYADAGHGLTIVVRADGTTERLASLDYPLGMVADSEWTRQQVTLNPGDMIVSFSDGVLDLYDGTLAAVEHLAAISRGSDSASDVVAAVADLAGGQDYPDDVTVIAVRRNTVTDGAEPDGETSRIKGNQNAHHTR